MVSKTINMLENEKWKKFLKQKKKVENVQDEIKKTKFSSQ
jgi:hypothetical protein